MKEPPVEQVVAKLQQRLGRGGVRLSYAEAEVATRLICRAAEILAPADPEIRRFIARRGDDVA